MGSMFTLQRIRVVLTWILGATMFAVIGMDAWIIGNSPLAPDPTTGRTHRIQWRHGVSYVTQEQDDLTGTVSDIALTIFLTLGPALLVVAGIEVQRKRRAAFEKRRQRSHAKPR